MQRNNGIPTKENGKLLGLDWNKEKDTISISFPSDKAESSKRGILSKIARVYDPLGLVSPRTLAGKLLYREACDRKLGWDAPLNESLAKRWEKWENELPDSVEVPRSLVGNREDIQEICLHAFGDASNKGVAAAVYAVVRQLSGDTQGLVAAKSRLSKQGLSIPRTELVSGHMATNLVDNVKTALEGFPVTEVTGWLDSTVALYWIEGKGQYKQFVHNRVRKICEKSYIKWRHVPTDQNPADIGSRAGLGSNDKQLWQQFGLDGDWTRLLRDDELLKKYRTTLNEYLEKGYAEKIPKEQLDMENRPIWYLPHHPVTHPLKPEKVRVVYDCAASYGRTSLNQQLLQGPDQTNQLTGVLIRLREESVAMVADVEAMFHQVLVEPRDCDALRFLWWPSEDLSGEMEEYRMTRYLFGATSSPSVPNFCLRKTAELHQDEFNPVAIETVKRNMYVDDLMKSAKETSEAIGLVSQLRHLLDKGGFRLTKWYSNSREVMKTIP